MGCSTWLGAVDTTFFCWPQQFIRIGVAGALVVNWFREGLLYLKGLELKGCMWILMGRCGSFTEAVFFARQKQNGFTFPALLAPEEFQGCQQESEGLAALPSVAGPESRPRRRRRITARLRIAPRVARRLGLGPSPHRHVGCREAEAQPSRLCESVPSPNLQIAFTALAVRNRRARVAGS